MSNPFLFTEEVGTAQLSNSNASFNPFLVSNDIGESDNDNPFMNTENVFESANIATNPFAIGTSSNVDKFFNVRQNSSDQTSINYEDIFSDHSQAEVDIFSQAPSQNNLIQDDLISSAETTTNIFCSTYESGYEEDKGPPRRPPPPRPGPPKETKDLILSVTGAMEATSSHLLDRLQATRTPSPTPMRDLHSPSPTQFGDLLEVDESSGITGPVSQSNDLDLLGDDFDFSSAKSHEANAMKRPSIGEGTMAPITPVPLEVEHVPPLAPVAKPAVPPARPAPPSIPERPRPPPQPPRPPIPTRPRTPEITPSVTPQQIVSPPQPVAPKEEIMQSDAMGFDDVFGIGIQSAPPKEHQPMEVPILPNPETIKSPPEVPPITTPIITGVIPKARQTSTETEPISNIDSSEQPFNEPTPIAAEARAPAVAPLSSLLTNILPTTPPAPPPTANVINEEPSVDIFDMGFSAAVSANSAAQATTANNFFQIDQTNSPFGGESSNQPQINQFEQEEFPPSISAAPSQPFNIFGTFGSNAQLPQEGKQDDFDAFAAKFDSAGLSDASVKADPFDPFSSGLQGAPAGNKNIIMFSFFK